MVFGPVLESSGLSLSLYSLGPLVVRWPMPVSFLREIASWCFYLSAMPSHVGWWGGQSTLRAAPAYGSQPPAEGAGPTCKTSSDLVLVMVTDVCRGKASFLVRRYLMEDLSPSVPAYGILHILNVFTGWCLPPVSHPVLRLNRMLIVCVPRNSLHTYRTEIGYRITNVTIYSIYYWIISLQKTKSNTLRSIAEERHHNSTGNRPGAIARLEHHIEVLQSLLQLLRSRFVWQGENSKVEYTYG
jgi:hypothetical protein